MWYPWFLKYKSQEIDLRKFVDNLIFIRYNKIININLKGVKIKYEFYQNKKMIKNKFKK